MAKGVKKLIRHVCLVAAAYLSLPGTVAAQAPPAPTPPISIRVEGDHFTVDRGDALGPKPKFLLFISYFDGMHARDMEGDLVYIARTLKFDGIRVMPNWQRRTSTYCPDETNSPDRLLSLSGNVQGDATSGPLKRLIDIIEKAAAEKLIVDVTFTSETYGPLESPTSIAPEDYIRGVTQVATLLRGYRNVIFDLQNEVDGKLDEDIVKRLRKSIQENPDPAVGDPSRIITVSKGGDPSGDLSDVIGYHQRVGTQVVAFHDSRSNGWQNDVGSTVGKLRLSGKPVYLQEPQAWNSGLTICKTTDVEGAGKDADRDPEHFRTAVRNARASGAAAWTFHTRQSFRLHTGKTLREWIEGDSLEKPLLEDPPTSDQSLRDAADNGTWGIDTTLSVDLQGTGEGRVTSSDGAIDCGGTVAKCVASFQPNSVVQLTVEVGSGSEFSGWEGCTGTSTCSVTLDVSRTVVAKFTAVEQVFYHDADAIGSTRLITDARGNPVERHDYTPFGVEMTPPTGLTPRLFAGKQRDQGTQFDYFGARYYSASLGRFTSADPIVDRQRAAAAPQRWVRYGYALQNPLRFGDPDGRETQLIVGFITENSPVGHVAIAINGVVFSYGTNWTKGPYQDWGVSLDKYLAAQEKLRQTAVVTLAVTPEKEAALLKELRTHNPNMPGSPKYSIVYGKTCVTTCERSLQKVGILPGAGPVRIDGAGNLLQAGAPSHVMPFSFALYVAEQGLPVYVEMVGVEKVSWWQSFWNALKTAVESAVTTERRDD